jgi:hypothetical protein
MADEGLFSQTIDRTRGGHGFVNILGHDPLLPGEAATLPAMEPYKHFSTAEAASEQAAKSAQEDYDRQRKDPNSQWYVPEAPSKKSMQNPNPLQDLPQILDRHSHLLDRQNLSLEQQQEKLFTTGPFAEAKKRQSIWAPQVAMSNVNAQSQEDAMISGKSMVLPGLPSAMPPVAQPGMSRVGAGTYKPVDLDRLRREQAAQDEKMFGKKKAIGHEETEDEIARRLGLK